MKIFCRSLCFVSFIILAIGNAGAADKAALSVELNNAEQIKDGCRLTFVVSNRLDVEVSDLALEVVLFGKDGKVMKFVVLGAGALPKGKTKVKRFKIGKSNCADLDKVLVNDVARCKGDSLAPKRCLESLSLSSKTEIKFGL